MTVVVETTTPSHPKPVFTGRSRWAAAALVTLGAALQVAEFAFEPTWESSTSGRVAWWLAHPDRMALSKSAGLLAIPFLIGGFLVMVALTRERSRRIATGAAAALTTGMVGLAAVHGVELAAWAAARAGHPDAAAAILDAGDLGLPGDVLLTMFLGGVLVGTALIYTAMWRSPLVPRLAVALGVAFVVLDVALAMSVSGHIAALASGLVLAWAVVTGYVRNPRPKRSSGSTLRAR